MVLEWQYTNIHTCSEAFSCCEMRSCASTASFSLGTTPQGMVCSAEGPTAPVRGRLAPCLHAAGQAKALKANHRRTSAPCCTWTAHLSAPWSQLTPGQWLLGPGDVPGCELRRRPLLLQR